MEDEDSDEDALWGVLGLESCLRSHPADVLVMMQLLGSVSALWETRWMAAQIGALSPRRRPGPHS